MNTRRVVALVIAESRPLLRERASVVGAVVAALGVGVGGASAGALEDWLPKSTARDEPAPAAPCVAGDAPPVAFAGDVPDWVAWPDTPVRPEEASLLITLLPPTGTNASAVLEVDPLVPDAPTRAARACLVARVSDEHRRRLDAVGVATDSDHAVVVRVLAPLPPEEAPAFELRPTLGATVAVVVLMACASMLVELPPRARTSGWLETWRALPGDRRELAWAWFLLTAAAGSALAALVATAWLATCALRGLDTGPLPWPALLLLAPALAAAGLRTFVEVRDARTAMLTTIPLMYVIGFLAIVAALLDVHAPGLGALVPYGGLLLVAAGAGSNAVTASTVTGAAALFFVWDAARVVARPEPRASVDDRRTERLARGAHVPEVVLLTAFALASSGVWVPAAFAGTPTALQSTLGFIGGFAAPAFAVPARLGLDLRDTLSLRVPAPRAWAALLLLVPGNLALAFVLTAALDPILPVPNWLAREVARVAQDVRGPELVLAFTLVPGICEELLFRGAMLGLLRRSARPRAEIVAIVVQAAAFAIAHGWAARLPYTFALGLVFGALAVRTRSIVPGMVAHTLHNLLVVTIGGEVLMAWAHHPWAWGLALLPALAVWAAGRGAVKG